MAGRRSARSDRLTTAAAAFLAANLLHGADHVRQGLATLDATGRAGGALVTLAAVGVLVLAGRRHPAAVSSATVVGFGAAALVTAAHVLPHWGPLSLSYVDDGVVDALSWAAVLLEIAAALALGAVAAVRLRTADKAVALHG